MLRFVSHLIYHETLLESADPDSQKKTLDGSTVRWRNHATRHPVDALWSDPDRM